MGGFRHTCFDGMQGLQPAALNAELFSSGKNNIEMLLGLLDDEPAGVSDFYVRYHTVQLLTALATVSSYRIQEVTFQYLMVTKVTVYATSVRQACNVGIL